MSRPLVVTDCDEVLLLHGAAFPRLAGRRARGRIPARRQSLRPGDAPQGHRRAGRGSRSVAPAAGLLRYRDAPPDRDRRRRRGDRRVAARSRRGGPDQPQRPYGEGAASSCSTHGIDARVFTNQGPKGAALRRDRRGISRRPGRCSSTIWPSTTPAPPKQLPDMSRLHLCGEPVIAPHVALRARGR